MFKQIKVNQIFGCCPFFPSGLLLLSVHFGALPLSLSLSLAFSLSSLSSLSLSPSLFRVVSSFFCYLISFFFSLSLSLSFYGLAGRRRAPTFQGQLLRFLRRRDKEGTSGLPKRLLALLFFLGGLFFQEADKSRGGCAAMGCLATQLVCQVSGSAVYVRSDVLSRAARKVAWSVRLTTTAPLPRRRCRSETLCF